MKKIRITESDLQKIVKRVIKEQTNEDMLCHNILHNYIFPIMDEHSIDEASDEFTYYDNVINWGIEEYIHSEEPNKEDNWIYRDYLYNIVRDSWIPI